jgi:UDP-N-acetylmuramoylalanine--D-glutamate ligase
MTSFDGLLVAVAGSGSSSLEVARVLSDLGARVTLVEEASEDRETGAQQAFPALAALPPDTGLVVVPEELPALLPLLQDAAARGVEVISQTELAWRLRPDDPAPWLVISGTSGTATAAVMLTSILTAAGRTTGTGSLLEQVLSGQQPDALVVPVTSRQLHWSSTIRASVGCLLNLSDAGSAWHGSFQAYALAEGRVLDSDTSIGFADDEAVQTLHSRAHGRRVSFTLQAPRPGEVGIVEDLLVDRAFPDVVGEATELGTLDDVLLTGDHHVAYALAAAAVARSFGVPASAVGQGLRSVVTDPVGTSLTTREPPPR